MAWKVRNSASHATSIKQAIPAMDCSYGKCRFWAIWSCEIGAFSPRALPFSPPVDFSAWPSYWTSACTGALAWLRGPLFATLTGPTLSSAQYIVVLFRRLVASWCTYRTDRWANPRRKGQPICLKLPALRKSANLLNLQMNLCPA